MRRNFLLGIEPAIKANNSSVNTVSSLKNQVSRDISDREICIYRAPMMSPTLFYRFEDILIFTETLGSREYVARVEN